MNTFDKIVSIYTIIRILIVATKNWKLTMVPLNNLISIISLLNIAIQIIIQIMIIFSCPLIFVSLFIMTDPLTYKFISILFNYLFN